MEMKAPTKKQLNTFVFGLDLIILIFAFKAYKAKNINWSLVLTGLAIVLLIIYLIRKDFVIQFYKVWMRCAAAFGTVITGIFMIVVFYFIFAPVGIFLRLIRKDILNLNRNTKLKSYWIDRPFKKFDKSDYEKQF